MASEFSEHYAMEIRHMDFYRTEKFAGISLRFERIWPVHRKIKNLQKFPRNPQKCFNFGKEETSGDSFTG